MDTDRIIAMICRRLKQTTPVIIDGATTWAARDARPHEVVALTPADLAAIIVEAVGMLGGEK
jgi:hypothetical protein